MITKTFSPNAEKINEDDATGLAAVHMIGSIGVAGLELMVAKALAKADMHPFWKWVTIAGLGGNAVTLMRNSIESVFPKYRTETVEAEIEHSEDDEDEDDIPDPEETEDN